MSHNREYKSTVFSKLFGDEKTLIEVYNALSGKNYPPDTPVEINTLDDVLWRSFRNDLSFTLDGRLVVLIEHQSTINENMPLRVFLYIADVYKRIVNTQTLLHRKLQKIPRPEFYVLYNGPEPYPDMVILSLADAFWEVPGMDELNLDLKVKVYNINAGHNAEMAGKCAKLQEYAEFVAQTRKYPDDTREAALMKAVEFCVKHNILAEFLRENSREVMNMLTEWSYEDEMCVVKEEGREEGREEERVEVARVALSEGLPIQVIERITGLDTRTIQQMGSR